MSLALQPLPKLPATAEGAATDALAAYSDAVPTGFAALLDLLAPPRIEGGPTLPPEQATGEQVPTNPFTAGAGLPLAARIPVQQTPSGRIAAAPSLDPRPAEAAALQSELPGVGARPSPLAEPMPPVPLAPAAPATGALDVAAGPSVAASSQPRDPAAELAPAQTFAPPPVLPLLAKPEPAVLQQLAQQLAQHLAPQVAPAAPQKTAPRGGESPRIAALEASAPPTTSQPSADATIATAPRPLEQEAPLANAPRDPGSAPLEMLATPRVSENSAAIGQRAPHSETAPPQPALPARVTWLAEQGGGTARLQLHPKELGDVEVSVRVRGRSVEIQFVADDPAAQFAVAGARERLLEALGARDLRMESFQIRSGDDGAPQRDAQNSHSDAHTQREASDRERSARDSNANPWQANAHTQRSAPAQPLRSITPSSVDLRV